MDPDPLLPGAAALGTVLSLAVGALAWTYGFVYAALALLVPYLRPGVLLAPLWLVFVYVVRPVAELLLFLLSPVIYPLLWILSWASTILAFVAQFKPLYTFLGTAAVIGIITGTILYQISFLISTLLGWNTPREEARPFSLPEPDALSRGSATPRCLTAAESTTDNTSQLEWYDSEVKPEHDEVADFDVATSFRKYADA